MKVAILLAGPYRGNETIIENHKKLIGEYDTYVSCFEHYLDDWKSSGWDVKEYFITPKINFNQTNWFKYRNNEPGQSGFWQFWNLKNVIDNVPKKYDWYIKSRCDLNFINSNINLDFFLSLESNTVYCPTNEFQKDRDYYTPWYSNNSINDQFYVTDEKTINTIGKFVTNYYDIEKYQTDQIHCSNEMCLRYFLNENNVIIKEFSGLNYVKDYNGETRPSGEYKFFLENI
jgi:hypothetical protein